MKNFLLTTALAAMAAVPAFAGGVDRSGQSIAPLFGEGTVVTLSYGQVVPNVSGTMDFVPLSSGDMGGDFDVMGAAFKTDLGQNTSAAIIIDEPFGANVSYPTDTGYPIAGTNGVIESQAITAVVRQKFGNFSVHAGLRSQTASANVEIWDDGAPAYFGIFDSNQGSGYLYGAAFEMPEIALRVDLTFNSEIDHTFPTTEPAQTIPTATTLPSSVNLNFQTGIAEDTLLFGSIRYVDWPVFNVTPAVYFAVEDDALISYDSATTSYSVGIGRRFNENWSGAVTLGYEAGTGGGDNFGPTDGYTSVGIGVTYTKDNIKITGGLSHSQRGDTNFMIDGDTLGSDTSFTGNTVTSAGVRIEMAI